MGEEVERGTTNPFQGQSVRQPDEVKNEDSELQGKSCCQPNEIKIEDRNLQERSERPVQISGAGMNSGEDDLSSSSVCYHEGGELFAEDVEQPLAVLPEVTTSSTEITIDDFQLGDPSVPLTEDQERLRRLI